MKTRKTAPKMHGTQRAYALALAAYETAHDAAEALIKSSRELAHAADEAEEAWEAIETAREQIREGLRVYDLSDAMRKAERAMVVWSCEVAKRHDPSKAMIVDETAEKAYLRPAMWKRLVDMAFRLAA